MCAMVVVEVVQVENLVSVIVPIYKVEAYLKNCVDSIIRQTYSVLEIILVDDGSPDKCGQICDDYAAQDKRVRVIHKKNGGLSDARNVGIDVAKGKYITFIDSDDYVAEDYVEVLLKSMLSEKADISICRLKATSKLNEDLKWKKNDSVAVYSSIEALEKMLYARELSTSACGRLFRIELFEKVRFPLGKYSEDLFTIYKTMLNANKIVSIGREAYFYYTRPGSITNEQFSLRHLDTLEALQIIRKDVVNDYPELLPAYKNQMIEALARLLKMNIPEEYYIGNGLWDEIKKYRITVMLDRKASKRVRAYAVLMFVGPQFTGIIMRKYYEYKWRKSLKST